VGVGCDSFSMVIAVPGTWQVLRVRVPRWSSSPWNGRKAVPSGCDRQAALAAAVAERSAGATGSGLGGGVSSGASREIQYVRRRKDFLQGLKGSIPTPLISGALQQGTRVVDCTHQRQEGLASQLRGRGK
jgi:hypothetical protein